MNDVTGRGQMSVSIILNDMDRSADAAHGFRSWMLQETDRPYEVILNLLNDRESMFRGLAEGCSPMCRPIINVYPRPAFFNIAAVNNLGLHVSSGEYVFFCNSDIIYPSSFLRTVVSELSRRVIGYALGARVNLTARQTQALRRPVSYTSSSKYDGLVGFENIPGRMLSIGCSPWMVRRDVASAIGGFDPRVCCHEDSEFNDRVIHYLRRKGLQQFIFAVSSLFGYHLDHPASELYWLSTQSKAILEPRRQRLLADPESEEDVLPTRLDSLDALLADLRLTAPPPPSPMQWQLPRTAYRRLRGAVRALIQG